MILIITLWSQNSDGSLYPKFEACEPNTCSNNQTISYPFYIEGIQEPFCGYPGFGLSCGNDGFPFLNMSNAKYMIHQIFYNNKSLYVSNVVFLSSNTKNLSSMYTKSHSFRYGVGSCSQPKWDILVVGMWLAQRGGECDSGRWRVLDLRWRLRPLLRFWETDGERRNHQWRKGRTKGMCTVMEVKAILGF